MATARQSARRAGAASIAVYYLLFNASYYYWTGGFSYGPRHLGAALPFMFLGLGQLWTIGSCAVRAILTLLAVYGLGLSLIAVSTIVMLPEDVTSPVSQVLLPAFLHADLAVNRQSFLQFGTAVPAQGVLGAWNVGEWLGLPGLASLVPLGVVWLAVATTLFRTPRH